MNRIIYSLVGLSSIATLTMSIILLNSYASADVTEDVAVIVPAACTLNNVVNVAHTSNVQNGHLANDIGTTTLTAVCNDSSGFSIYAVGYSNDTYGNTNLIASLPNNTNIATGLATSGGTSAWAMKLTPVTGTYAPTIVNGFSSYKAVPSTYTKVATYSTANDTSVGSSLRSTYRVFVSATQAADTYTGKVRYTLVHPASEVPTRP